MSLIQKPSQLLLVYTKKGTVTGINKINGHEQFTAQLPPLIRIKSSKPTNYFYKLDKHGNLYYGVDEYSEKLPLNILELTLRSPTKSGQILVTGQIKNHFVAVKNGKIEAVNSAQCVEDGVVIGVSTYSLKLIHLVEDISWDLEYTKLHGHDKVLTGDLQINEKSLEHENWRYDFDDDILGYFDAQTHSISHVVAIDKSAEPKDLALSRFSKDLQLPLKCDINSPFYPQCSLVPSTNILREQKLDYFEIYGAIFVIVGILIAYTVLYFKKSLFFPRFMEAKFEITKHKSMENLVLSENVLGYGSNGTVVFKGSFNGRPVAIKRMLKDFVAIAEKEVKLLQSTDINEHVVRLFFLSQNLNFAFVVLELCDGNLDQFIQNYPIYDAKNIIKQIVQGLEFIHELKIVHRDLKPVNILYQKHQDYFLFKITDFGLGKMLDDSKSSFMTAPNGTKGWRSPEILKMLENPDCVLRLTKESDIFAVGLIVHFILSHGVHPFGDIMSRELNILHGKYEFDLFGLDANESFEADLLISDMISYEYEVRPTCHEILSSPFFWSEKQKLAFICNISNRLETEKRGQSILLKKLEALSDVYKNDWSQYIHNNIFKHLIQFRRYYPHLMQDLLRAVRNLVNHFQELPPHILNILSNEHQPSFMCVIHYFLERFPNLITILIEFAIEANILDEVLTE
eukprot:NODE_13_length_54415_cov_0.522424.p5 type:complete len:683 gc:universal NODE_13_length_54415_cov_0.522424:33210-31162(-)